MPTCTAFQNLSTVCEKQYLPRLFITATFVFSSCFNSLEVCAAIFKFTFIAGCLLKRGTMCKSWADGQL